MFRHSSSYCRVLLATILPLAAASTASSKVLAATDAPVPESTDQLAEVVVTAQKREQREEDVPISVTVISGAELVDKGLVNLQDIAVQVPGVKVTPMAGATNLVNIRGFGSGLATTFDLSVPTFVDGAYHGRGNNVESASFDLQSVEVLKGPQTLFFGNSAIAGAFNVTTRKPILGDSLRYDASAELGSDSEYHVNAGISVPLGEQVAIRLAGTTSGTSGYIENSYLGTDDPNKSLSAGRFSLVAMPVDVWRIEARFDYNKYNYRRDFTGELVDCPSRYLPPGFYALAGESLNMCSFALASGGGTTDSTLDGKTQFLNSWLTGQGREVSVKNELTVGPGTITALTTYNSYNYEDFQAFPGTPGPVSLPTNAGEDYDIATQELRYTASISLNFDIMAGAYYAKSNLKNTVDAFFGVPLNFGIDENDQIRSGFLATTYRFGESGISIDVGARYSSVKKSADRSVLGFPVKDLH